MSYIYNAFGTKEIIILMFFSAKVLGEIGK